VFNNAERPKGLIRGDNEKASRHDEESNAQIEDVRLQRS